MSRYGHARLEFRAVGVDFQGMIPVSTSCRACTVHCPLIACSRIGTFQVLIDELMTHQDEVSKA
ncbi:uncharacterized protein K489DRAFT_376244 [Dissoconium aciculare CBS 342.82]|uniref:Uncharacterized protein n=1 Tax=Dissoconium aciculare CBS 342.82 TaxID=1314786 RepID=A0A6J3MD86_9PEZI|nr:uncharacterized protein K489DRAFT_376244 [Dissoconium aciculare CBS 342.82]KAF1825848.1 hypothetical protein K489DRAFT_376244 [Dissoconium aciculare CBS 342.82]